MAVQKPVKETNNEKACDCGKDCKECKKEKTVEITELTATAGTDPNDKTPLTRGEIMQRIQTLNVEYKKQMLEKQRILQELTKVEEKILKFVGAYQELKKILASECEFERDDRNVFVCIPKGDLNGNGREK